MKHKNAQPISNLFRRTFQNVKKANAKVKENIIRQIVPRCLTDAGAVVYLHQRGFMFCRGPSTPPDTEEVHYQNQYLGSIVESFEGGKYNCKFVPTHEKSNH